MESFLNIIYFFPWVSFFDDTWVLQLLLIYVLYLLFINLNVYYTLLYLFLEIILVGFFIGLIQMELFTGFLWVVEGTVIFIAIILLIHLNSDGSNLNINIKIYKFLYVLPIFLFFILLFKNSFFFSDYIYFNFLNFNELYDNFYEAIENKNMNDFLLLFISFYIINSLEFILIGILLLIGSVVCVHLNKMQKTLKIEQLNNYFNIFSFYTDFLNFFFFRKQNLFKQTNYEPSIRIYKRKK